MSILHPVFVLELVTPDPRAVLWVDGHPVFVADLEKRSATWEPWPRLQPVHREFLLAHWDWFIDQGWTMDAWFLVDCERCGASAFEVCRNLRNPKKPIRWQHRRLGVE